MHGIPLELQKLVRGTSTLADYKIGDGSTISLVLREKAALSIFVEMESGKVIPLEAEPSVKTDWIKDSVRVREKHIPPPEQLMLMHGNNALEDELTLSRYGMIVGEEYTLHLIIDPAERPHASTEIQRQLPTTMQHQAHHPFTTQHLYHHKVECM